MARLSIRCSENGRCGMNVGTGWYFFGTTSEAIEFAGTIVRQETELTVYDAAENVTAAATVLPTRLV